MAKDANNCFSFSKQPSSEEKESSLNFEESEDYHDEEEGEEQGQRKVEKVDKGIKKIKPNLRGRPKDDKTANREKAVAPKQNFDQDNLNCIIFKYRLDVMSTNTIRDKFYEHSYNPSASSNPQEVDNSNIENENDDTKKKRKRRQKSVEDSQSELKSQYLQKKNKKIKESNKSKYDEQVNIQYYNEALKPLDLQLDRGLTEIEQIMVDSTQQFKKILKGYFFDNFAQMKNEYSFFDEMMIHIMKNQSNANWNIRSRAERSGCTVIPPFFWEVIEEIFIDTFNSRQSPYYSRIFFES